MKKVLVAYVSLTGKTQQMAEYIAEGIRISGHEAETKRSPRSRMRKICQDTTVMSWLSNLSPRHDREHEDLSFSGKEGSPEGKVGGPSARILTVATHLSLSTTPWSMCSK